MYELHQFRAAVYFLLLLGIWGFALAAESPGLWIIGTGGVLLHVWLVKTGRFTPMPRILANLVTLASLALVTLEVRAGGVSPILTVGQFIVLLHLVKLFELRANRDYAQLLVLSLLLMVAAAISTASLLFGIMLIVYMFFSLHCCLLFHLKMEVDQARQMYQQPVDHLSPALLRQDARDLPRSMRRLTGLIAAAGIAMAVLVFLFFPRGAGQTLLGPLQSPASQALSGFNDQVSFQELAKITPSEDVVARVELYCKGQRVTHPMEMRLRGSVLNVYSGNDANRGLWQWGRSQNSDRFDNVGDLSSPDVIRTLDSPETDNSWKQVINLQPTGTNKLFAMAGPINISSPHEMQIRFSRADGVLESSDQPILQPIQYTVTSSGELPAPSEPVEDGGERSVIDPAVAAYVRRPAVCGADANGQPLAQYPLKGNHAFDHEIAANIERHLRDHFAYTLDLTNRGSLGNRDPMAAFLTDFKRGHCEYFAGAMTLMCQSLGIPARYVVGFRCEPDDFNAMGDYFLVRQSNAHAWCEVLTGRQWETFDPTSGRGDAAGTSDPYLTDLKKIVDYLEFKWATSVVAYDTGDRKNLILNLNTEMFKTAASGSMSLQSWMADFQGQLASPSVLSCVITGMILLCALAVGWFLVERWRLHRRAQRIGIKSLSTTDQLRLVRQLSFYDDLMRILARHHIERPQHLTPLEFSRSLAFLPADVYRDIHRLTQLFYRIRYGGSTVLSPPRRHLAAVVYRIQKVLDSSHHDFP
jgi:hypothetical protein